MVIRFFKNDGCVRFFKHVNRVILNPLGNVEVRITIDEAYQWRTFKKDVDFDSFILSTE